jgi:hypothetical protein
MGRVALSKTKIIVLSIAALCAVGAGSIGYVATRPHSAAHAMVAVTRPTTHLSYRGQQGIDALSLLKQHASVQTKHYSFGDMVVAINGVAGNGPKYWTFYINGKEANVGAGSYVTKGGDLLDWKLQ